MVSLFSLLSAPKTLNNSVKPSEIPAPYSLEPLLVEYAFSDYFSKVGKQDNVILREGTRALYVSLHEIRRELESVVRILYFDVLQLDIEKQLVARARGLQILVVSER